VGFEPTNLFWIGASVRRAHNVALAVCTAPQTVDYALFGKWLYQNYRPFTARPVLAYAKKYGHLLLSGNLNPLLSFSDGKRSATVKSFATLRNWEYSGFKYVNRDFSCRNDKKNIEKYNAPVSA
jgi:hypothetical protein